jgi:hypothetical protein
MPRHKNAPDPNNPRRFGLFCAVLMRHRLSLLAGGFVTDFDNLTAIVITAVGTHMVRLMIGVAVGAFHQVIHGQFIVIAPVQLAPARHLALR